MYRHALLWHDWGPPVALGSAYRRVCQGNVRDRPWDSNQGAVDHRVRDEMSDDESTAPDDGSNDAPGSIATKLLRTAVPDAIRRRFALKFVIVLLVMGVVIVAVGFVATNAISAQTQDRTVEEYESLAAQQGNLVSQWVEGRQEVVRTISDDPVWTSNNTTRMTSTLTGETMPTLSESAFEIRLIGESDVGATVFVASSGSGQNLPIEGSRYEWIADTEFDGPNDVVISPTYRAGTTGKYVVAFASPTADGNRTFVAEMQLTPLAEQLSSDRVSGGFSYVVNESGAIMLDTAIANSSVQNHNTTGQYGDEQALDASATLQNAESGVMTNRPASTGVMGQKYAVGYSPVIVAGQDLGWHAMIHAPRSQLFGFANSVSQTGLVVSVVLGFVIVLIGAVLGFNTSRSIDRLTGKAEKIEEGNLDVDISSGRIDNIGRLYDGFANMRDALRQQIEEAEAARKEAEVSRAEAMEMNNYLQEKAEEYSEIMQACARGDLTRRMEPEGENEAIDQIAADFNEMITELEMTTGQLKTFADEVEEGGQSLQQSAETVRDASEQVADSVQKISDDAYDQKERLQRISERMDEVATTLEELADDHPDLEFDEALSNIRDVASDIEQAVELGEQTMSESENVAGAAEEQAAELNEVSARADELTRYAQYLGDGLGNFETEEEHEFVFQTGASSPDPSSAGEGDDS